MNRLYWQAEVLVSSIVSAVLCAQPIAAQVIPDDTLPAGERSQVTGNPNFQIDGGARRGGNLFHSFQSFSIPRSGSAHFNNALDVQNIFSRVTGSSASNIDGLIRANGTANLFLLNPNGILFGPNASLNIGGSFVATTADAIGFSTGEVFSSDATQPLPSQLLTVNPNAFFFNQLTPQPITVQARFDNRVFAVRTSINGTGLHVPPRQNLMLVGGAIQFNSGEPFVRPEGTTYAFDGGWLISPGSYVELGAVGAVGSVGLSTTGSDWQLTILPQVARADISFNESGIATQGTSSSIRLLARNIDFVHWGYLRSGIPRNVGLPDTQLGAIELNATGSITFSNSGLINWLEGQGTLSSINLTAGDRISINNRSWIESSVYPTGVGNAGNINITTGSLSLTNWSHLQSVLSGEGNTGSVNIHARDTVSFDDSTIGVVNQVGIGNAGDINITTESLFLTNIALVYSFTGSGQGNAGNANINARDTVSLTGGSSLSSYTDGPGNAGSVNINADNTISFDDSLVTNYVLGGGIGNSGGINITTGSLSLTNGSLLLSYTAGQGNAGNVTVNARDAVSIDGAYRYRRRTVPTNSGIFTQVLPSIGRETVRQGGNVTITTDSLFLTNGGNINTSTEGQGNAGRVTIDARDSVQISGTAPTFPDLRSEVFTSAAPSSVGRGGDVSITTGSLSVFDQGRINTNAQGQGEAGNIQIQASDAVLFDGTEATTTLESGAVGRGGNIDIEARSLSLLNGAQLSTSTRGQGDAGDVTVAARDRISLTGGTIAAPGAITTRTEAGAVGNSGRIDLSARRISLTQGGQLATTTASQGRAGNISITATERVTITGTNSATGRVSAAEDQASTAPLSGLYTNTEPGSTGRGGNIRVMTGALTVERGGRVVASTAGQGDAGSIRVRAAEGVRLSGTSLDGFSSGLLTNTETTATGQGGTIRVTTPTLQVSNGAVLSARSSSAQRGGEIIVNADTVDLTRGGQLLTTASSRGNAGDITVTAGDRFRIIGSDPTFDARLTRFGSTVVDPVSATSGLFTNTEANSSGAGGAIALTTDSLSLLGGGRLVTSTTGRGNAGAITVHSSNLRLFGASSGLFAQTATAANAGNLTIRPQGNEQSVTVQLQEGAQISASTASRGRGGRLTITAPDSITLTGNGSIISAETSGRGTGGDLTLQAGTLNVQDQAEVTVSSSGQGSAGSLFVDVNEVYLDNQGSIRADTSGSGIGGNLTLQAGTLDVQNQAEVTVSSSGSGSAGSLLVDADRLTLNNQGSIRADTSGGGGDVEVRSPFILLQNGSNITTNATGNNIPGGNIDIDTGFLVAVPNEDSTISANSEDFRGGNVSIDAIVLYGIEPSMTSTPLSDITATGATSALPGTVDVTTATIDPTAGLVALPTELVDASQLMAQGCPAQEGNSFIISGRGGLPPTPEQQLDDNARWSDRRRLIVPQAIELGQDENHQHSEERSQALERRTSTSIVEATEWQTTATGEVMLIANTANSAVQNSSNQAIVCRGREPRG